MLNTRWTDQLIGKIGQIRLIYGTTIIRGEIDGDYDVDDGNFLDMFFVFSSAHYGISLIEHSLGKQ